VLFSAQIPGARGARVVARCRAAAGESGPDDVIVVTGSVI
jgi:hypothetical protein